MKLDDALNDALISALEEDEAQNVATPEELYDAGWRPPLNPIQRQMFECKQKYVLAYGERAGGKCLQKDSLLFTGDGLKRIGELVSDPIPELSGFFPRNEWTPMDVEVMSFDGTSVRKARTDQFYSEPSRKAKLINFSNGNTIRVSPVHPIWGTWMENGEIKFGFKTSSELQSGSFDFYAPCLEHSSFTKTELQIVRHRGENSGPLYATKITPDLGYLIGVLVGDGGLSQSQIMLSTADQGILDAIKPGLDGLGGNVRKTPCGKYDYSLKAPELQSLTRALKMRTLSKHKRIPSAIIESPKSVLIAFLQGLFDTDGWVEKSGAVGYCSASEGLSWDVHNCLQAIGIFSTRRFRSNKCAGAWHSYIYAEDAERFSDIVNFKLERKRESLKQRLKDTKLVNRNKNGYPDFITTEMARVRNASNIGRKPTKWRPFKLKQVFRKRSGIGWSVAAIVDGKYTHGTFSKIEDAKAFCAAKEAERSALPSRSKAWHHKNRAVVQCRYVPSPDKLMRFKELVGWSDTLERLQLSTRWVKVESVSECEAELVDISVPETHAFLANGMIQHNTLGCVHKVVDHCFQNPGAMAYIVVKELGQAKEGGAWTKLVRIVLPQWKEAIGLQYSEIKTDKDTQRPFVWITARNGEMSMVMLLSLYVGDHVADKVKGKEASFFMVDEAQTTESDDYFTELVMAMGRTNVEGTQQIIYCANPKGMSHWLYIRFWITCVDKRWGNRRKDYAVFHVPIEENKHNLKPGYWENVLEACRGDEIKTARMIRGEWVDEPEGDSVFGHIFNAKRHVRGEPRKNIGIHPSPNFPLIISYDLGSAHSSITFEQILHLPASEDPITKEKIPEKFPAIVFDELDFVGQWEPYWSLVPKLVRRLEYWDTLLGGKARFVHISDSSAFDQYRAKDGSFDAKDVQDLSKKYVSENNLDKKFVIRMRECPKGPHTVHARVHLVSDKLALDELFISAMCPRARELFLFLEEDKDEKFKLKRSNHLHRFDSLTYGLFYYKLRKGGLEVQNTESQEPQVYAVGNGK